MSKLHSRRQGDLLKRKQIFGIPQKNSFCFQSRPNFFLIFAYFCLLVKNPFFVCSKPFEERSISEKITIKFFFPNSERAFPDFWEKSICMVAIYILRVQIIIFRFFFWKGLWNFIIFGSKAKSFLTLCEKKCSRVVKTAIDVYTARFWKTFCSLQKNLHI